jgi:BirA family transcriptional regulator, biotin operon repressor / biotin---[acetyl-CoA-carboxylase] ligase
MTPIGKEIYHLDSVDSTNNFAAKLINDQICQNTAVILADRQTAGKGQMGNTWESAHAANLLCSFVWKPDNLSVTDQSKISWMISLSLHKLLLRLGIDSEIKWPNDIYVGSQKIAGILIENQLEGNQISWVIAGIGLNVNQLQFEIPNATSVQLLMGTTFRIKTILNELTDILNGYLRQWNSIQSSLKSDYESLLYQKGENALYADVDGEFEGEIIGVQDDGRLQINVRNEIRCYSLKEIQFCSK